MQSPPGVPASEGQRGGPPGDARQLWRLVELLPIGAAYAEGERLLVNRAVEVITGYRRDELATMDAWFTTLFGPEAETIRGYYDADLAAGFRKPRVVELHRRDGQLVLLEFHAAAADDAVVWTMHDVTEREMAMRALGESEARFRSLVEAGAQIVWRMTPGGDAIEGMEAFIAFTGQSRDDLFRSPRAWLDAVHPDDRQATHDAFVHAVATGTPYDVVHRLRRHDGEWRTMHGRAVPVRKEDGTIREWIGTHADITERAQAERILQLLADASSLVGAEMDLDELLQHLASMVRGRLGDTCLIELTGDESSPSRWMVASTFAGEGGDDEGHEGEQRTRVLADLAAAAALREGGLAERALAARESIFVTELTGGELVTAADDPAGQLAELRRLGVTSLLAVPLVAHGEVHGVVTFLSLGDGHRITDDDCRVAELLAGRVALAVASTRHHAAAQAEIAERRQVEAALRESQAQLEEAQRLGRIGSWSWDAATGATRMSPEYHRIIGIEPGSPSPTPSELREMVLPDDRVIFDEITRVAHSRILPQAAGEYRVVRPDGRVRRLQARAEWTYDAEGRPLSGFGTVQDVTEQRQLEEQVQQAQKMEAVGRLAGGVAHDFNNLLTIISGAAQFLLADSPVGDPRRADALEITRAAQRAGELTRQLLTFSRRQVVHPRLVNVGMLVRDSQRMLRRLISESVELETVVDDHLPPVYVDPGQLEQVLVNLVVNASDAMPAGGRLSISTERATLDAEAALRPGVAPVEYVVLSVSDTGTGMDEATRARLFEPFFTTKKPGKGTGLGLPIVFGIVKQAGGHVLVETEPGVGSTFSIYLPPAMHDVTDAEPSASLTSVPGGSETILVVEDEASVRRLARRALEMRGYTVLEAGSGAEALALSDGHEGPIHLVLTDVVMPGMSGHEVATALERRRPGIRTLYMSGYAADELLHHRVTESDVSFIEKPFTVAALADAVRRALASDP